MNIEITAENLLNQLGYSVNEASLKQINKIIESTKGFDKFAKHILSLNDHLKHLNGYVTLSNSVDKLKIKTETTNEAFIEEFNEIVQKWAQKYNVRVEKLENKNVYYIYGIEDK